MGRNKYPELTKERIINVAMRLFIERGYEKTFIQDVINELGDLTKGAIYYHFKSKEDLFEAVIEEIGDRNIKILSDIKNMNGVTGKDKLKMVIKAGLNSQNTRQIMEISPNFIENPRFLAFIFKQIQDVSVPEYITPIIAEGIKDGSIEAENPEMLAELIMLLINVWLNPLIFNTQAVESKCKMINSILGGFNIVLFDECPA